MQYEVYNNDRLLITTTESLHLNHIAVLNHTFNLSRMPWVYSCKIFLASVNFNRFDAKKLALSTDFTRKSGVSYRFNAKIWRFSV